MIPCQRFEYTKHWKNHNKTAIFYLCDLEYRREAREVCRADRTHRGGVCLFTPWYANEYCGENTSMRTFVPCGEKQVWEHCGEKHLNIKNSKKEENHRVLRKPKYAHMATHPSAAAVMNSLGRGGVRHASIARQNPLSSAIYPFLSNLSF